MTVTVTPHCTQKKNAEFFFGARPYFVPEILYQQIKKTQNSGTGNGDMRATKEVVRQPHWYEDPSCLGRQGQAGMVRGKGAWAQPQRA